MSAASRPLPVAARGFLAAVFAAALLLSACGGDDDADGERAEPTGSGGVERSARRERLGAVEHWLYLIGGDLDDETVEQIEASDHDLVVLDFSPSVVGREDFPMGEVVARLHEREGRIVLAYVDIGEAEDYRTYWEDGWEVGDPGWIVATDPDGWEGNYPVAYWDDEWQGIWLEEGLLDEMVTAGFDGHYLDWVEAYDDDRVIGAAEEAGVDPVEEMAGWVAALASAGRDSDTGFLVVGQNAAALALGSPAYRDAIDALAQEQVWFDGGADDDPPGGCPLPRTEADIDSDAYVASLTPECRRQWEEFPESTLHVSSEEYLEALEAVQDRGLPIFVADYATDHEQVEFVRREARARGFIPFVGVRSLDRYEPPG